MEKLAYTLGVQCALEKLGSKNVWRQLHNQMMQLVSRGGPYSQTERYVMDRAMASGAGRESATLLGQARRMPEKSQRVHARRQAFDERRYGESARDDAQDALEALQG